MGRRPGAWTTIAAIVIASAPGRAAASIPCEAVTAPPGVVFLYPDTATSFDANGNAFVIDGTDVALDGTSGPMPAIYGVAARNAANAQEAIASLSANQLDNVTGKGFVWASPPTPSIGVDATVDVAMIEDFVTRLLALPHVVDGSAVLVGGGTLGDAAAPVVTHLQGQGSGVTFQANASWTGAGILVVEDGLTVLGTLDYRGLIVVRGPTTVNGSLTLFGSLWSDDAKLPVGGTAVMQYSSEALALAVQAGGDQACRVTCVSEPNGAPCDDGDACTAADTCMDGRCTSGAPVACGLCAQCDSARGCIGAPAVACHAPMGGRSDLAIRRSELAVANRLVWRWRSARAPWDMGNSYVDYGLCLFGGPDASTLLFHAFLPVASTCGDRPCWTTPGHRYTDRLRTTGIATVKLNASATGKTSIRVLGGGATLALPPLPVEPPIRVQLRAANGLCWEAAYPAPSVAQAEAGLRARIVMP